MNERLIELVLRYEEACEQGQQVTPEELCRDCPELLDDLRAALGRIRGLDAMLATRTDDSAGEPRAPARVGEYAVLGELGKGGMGVVYKGRHEATQELVAVKLLREGLDGPDQVARFRREAAALATLRHPNVVRLLGAGEHEGKPYLVMELVTGGSLEAALASGPPLPQEAAQRAEVLARAVQAAHDAGIVHRDLKPSNVLLSAEGALKVTDFGLAKRLDAGTRQTASGAILGTPSYMSPEQATGQGRQVGPPTDVWSLGVILYEMLTGQLPFRGANAYEALQRVCGDEPAPPRQVRKEVPRDLETICLKCLHKEPGRRYGSAAELADDLRRYLEDRPIKARRVGLGERLVKWRRRNPAKSALAVVAVTAALAAGLAWLWYWDRYQRVKVEYFANLVTRFGVKEGVGRLSKKEAQGRTVSYKVYRRGGRVIQVDAVNGHGELTGAHDVVTTLEREEGGADNPAGKACRFRYERAQKGELRKEVAEDRNGNVVWVLNYTSPRDAFYSGVRRGADAPGQESGRPGPRTRSGAVWLEFDWSPAGFARTVKFRDGNQRPQPDEGGAFQVRFAHDDRGLVVREEYLGERGQLQPHRTHRVAAVERQHDGQGNVLEEAYFGAEGRPALYKDGYHKVTARYDDRGNHTELACFGVDGQPTVHRSGFARWTARHDERGNTTGIAFFGVDGRPTVCGDGYHKSAARFDERGNRIELAYFGVDDRPALHRDGNHRYTARFDRRGNRVESAYFDAAGRPTLVKDGYHRYTVERDEHGNQIEVAYFSADDQPALHRDGDHKFTAQFDDRGNRVEIAYFGPDGKPTLHKNGYHRARMNHDERGNHTEWACFGVDGAPAVDSTGGAHRGVNKYDERGNLVETAYFGVDGKPTTHKNGYHRITLRRDERGAALEQAHFGVDSRPTIHREGYHKVVARFDERGNRIEMAYFGVDGKPAPHKEGYQKVCVKHDERGNVVELTYFGADDQPTTHEEGNHKWTARFDERGNRVEAAYFGLDNRPMRHKDGYHKTRSRFDERGNLAEWACFDTDGGPCLDRADGAHRTVYERDERGNAIERADFGVDGKPVLNTECFHKLTARFDERGNRIEAAYFGPDGKPTRHKNGFHKAKGRYDDWGNRIETAYFGVDGRRQNVDGYHKLRSKYDRWGNRVEWACFGTDGKPCVDRADATHRTTWAFDERGNPMEWAYFGVDGKPGLHRDGYHKARSRYDERGNPTERAFFGVDGRPTLQRNGCARWTARYDPWNNRTGSTYYDTEGRRLLPQVKIMSVAVEGRGAVLGLRVGDVLLRYDGRPVEDTFAFLHRRRLENKADKPRPLVVQRGERAVMVLVSPGLLGVVFSDFMSPTAP
jgi:hypothetical protein